MLGIEDTSKKELFMHYCARPGFEKLKRWVRDKNYKLYESSGGSKYRFYNIKKDENERDPINNNELTDERESYKT